MNARPFQNEYSANRLMPIGALGIALSLLGSACTASIRPAGLDVVPPSSEAVDRGRALLAAAAKAHGQEAYQRAETVQYEMTDSWQGLLGTLGNPWPDSEVQSSYEPSPPDFRRTRDVPIRR